MLALSSVSAQNVRFVPAGQPVTNVTPFGLNNRQNIPTTFNGASGFNVAFANGNLLNSGVIGLNNFNGFNNGIQRVNAFNGFQGVNLTNGLTSLGDLSGYYGLNGYNYFGGLDGTIVTNDGTYIQTNGDYRRGGFLNSDFYNDSRIRYANQIDTSRNGQVIRAIPTPVSAELAQICITKKCNTESFPVCGVNSRNYVNLCQLECSGIDFARDGVCFAN